MKQGAHRAQSGPRSCRPPPGPRWGRPRGPHCQMEPASQQRQVPGPRPALCRGAQGSGSRGPGGAKAQPAPALRRTQTGRAGRRGRGQAVGDPGAQPVLFPTEVTPEQDLATPACLLQAPSDGTPALTTAKSEPAGLCALPRGTWPWPPALHPAPPPPPPPRFRPKRAGRSRPPDSSGRCCPTRRPNRGGQSWLQGEGWRKGQPPAHPGGEKAPAQQGGPPACSRSARSPAPRPCHTRTRTPPLHTSPCSPRKAHEVLHLAKVAAPTPTSRAQHACLRKPSSRGLSPPRIRPQGSSGAGSGWTQSVGPMLPARRSGGQGACADPRPPTWLTPEAETRSFC